MRQQTYLTCIGTRPEIIKIAPLYRRLKAQGNRMIVVHTGQHEAVADALYAFFEMPPDVVIKLKRRSTSLAHLTSALMDGVQDAMVGLNPDAVIVQGDTTSALVGALTGYYHRRPVAHIEAGLRTGRHEPFPEEKNREIIARLAYWHFPPTHQAKRNLLAEGIDPSRVFEVGNTVIDAALWARDHIARPAFDALRAMPPDLRTFLTRHRMQRMILITAHRRENWGQPIRNIARAVASLIARHPQAIAIWPIHPNPTVRNDVATEFATLPRAVQDRICLTEPLSYPFLIDLLARCEFTLTDSGGIQEEASVFAKPVLIARTSTERQELVDAGGARLVGTEVADILATADLLLADACFYRSMQLPRSPFGDGRSAARIVEILSRAGMDDQRREVPGRLEPAADLRRFRQPAKKTPRPIAALAACAHSANLITDSN